MALKRLEAQEEKTMGRREMQVWSLEEATRRSEERTQHGGAVFFFGAEEGGSLEDDPAELMAQVVEEVAEEGAPCVRLPSRFAVYLRRGDGADASEEFGFEAVPTSEAFLEMRRLLAAAVERYAESIDDPHADFEMMDRMFGGMVDRFAGEVREAWIVDPPQVAWVRLTAEDWTPAVEDWFGGMAIPVVVLDETGGAR